jgi:membrane protease YdiL (CAAX protease family)
MSALLRNRHFQLFTAIVAGAIAVLVAEQRPLGDAVGALVILGVLLPLVALLATARMPRPTAPQSWRQGDAALILGLLAWIVLFLLAKGALLAAVLPHDPDPRLHETVNTLIKLFAFVLVPWLVLRRRGLGWASGGRPTASRGRLWLAFAVMALAALAVQALLGSQFKRLLGGEFTTTQIALGGTLCLAWMSVEAGVVEEFFFRWFLQGRLAAWAGSEVSGIFLAALIFGLAHAPGILLRGAGVQEGLGAAPGVATTLAYVIVTQGVAGLSFGVLWSRTRSFVLVVLLHGFFDALSNTASFIETWWR